MSDSAFSPFPPSDIGAATVVNVFAVISASALFSVALRVVWLAVRQKLSPEGAKPQEYIFFNTQLGYYALCLLIANSITDGAGLIGLRWLFKRGITEGALCTVQAVLMQFGTFSTAYFTVSIAVHTFNSLVLRKRQSALIAWITITVGWIYSGLLVAVPFTNRKAFRSGAVYGPDHLSCGVRSIYLKTQFFFHLLPIFIASILSAILYPLIFLVLRGTLTIKGGIKLTLDPNERNAGTLGENYHRFVIRVAKSMLWYPVAYIALLVPYSVVRLLSISGFPVAFGVLIFAYVCWFMLGIVNVLLLYNTFRVLGPAFDISSQRESVISFGPSTQLDFDAQFFDKQQEEFSDKVAQYRNAQPLRRSPSITSVDRSSPILRPLLPIYEQPERYGAASVQSFYSYSTHPSIGRAIASVHELERSSPSPRLSPRLSHSRQGTMERIGLPPAPRPVRSPILLRPSREDLAEPAWPSPNPTLQRQYSARTLSRRSSRDNRESAGSGFSDFESADWQMAEPTSAFLSNNLPRAPLSAVTPTFMSTSLPRIHGSPQSASIRVESPTGIQRPVLGGRESIGSAAASGRSRTTGNYF